MSFTVFQNNTTHDAIEVNDNFYHIAQGDFIPRTGVSLTADVTGLIDLGSSSYKWDSLYANAIVAGSVSGIGIWNLITTVILSASSSDINITGLNGDTDGIYMIDRKSVV